MRHRVVGIVKKENNILLMRRLKNGQEYYVFPGGGVEDGESYEEALKREMKEELGIDINNPKLFFDFKNQFQDELYYLVESFNGSFELGGPEKKRMDNQNKYFLEWVELANIKKMTNLYPKEATKRLFEFLKLE